MKLLLLILTLSLGTLNGWCQTYSPKYKSTRVPYQDSAYLDIPGNLLDPSQEAESVWSSLPAYLRAHARFTGEVYIRDYKLAWDIKSGAEINISENLYNYFVKQTKYGNEVNLPSGDYEIRKDRKEKFYFVCMKKVSTKHYARIKRNNKGRPGL